MSTAKKIVENVLSIGTTKKLWTSVYLPALPFTPQDFTMGAVMPAVLYMFRWGHRRGNGTFLKTFGKQDGDKIKPPTIEDVANILTERDDFFTGFKNEIGKAIHGDMLLSFCLENKNHQIGRTEQLQRAYPAHYLASWIDLPLKVTNLRYIPEMIVSLLTNQEEGEFIIRSDRSSKFLVGVGFDENILLKLFGTGMRIRGDFRSNLTSDEFIESEEGDSSVGIDQLLTIRMAQVCGEAPMKAKGFGESEKILNQHPLAKKAANFFREDLSIFIQAYGETIPRQAFLQMLESCLSLGLSIVYLSTAKMLLEWERTGILPENHDQQPWSLFVDCSSGNDLRLRRLAEESMSDLSRRFEKLPVIMMCLRILDDQVKGDPVIKKNIPQSQRPDSTEFINYLGSIMHNAHECSRDIQRDINKVCLKLTDALQEEDEEPAIQELLRQDNNPVVKLAEALCLLMGSDNQLKKFYQSIDSCMAVNQPNGLATKRKIQHKDTMGKTVRGDARSIILANPMLDFIVHRHLRKAAKGKGPTSLAFVDLLNLLKDRYGLYVDEVPPGMSIPTELLHLNRQILERRLRDLGVLVGVNDAESMKRLQQRFMAKGDGNDE
jgi:hypothetical protein